MASYLVGVRQFTAFLQPHGRELTQATRGLRADGHPPLQPPLC
jgi:hypothetical protein